MSTTAQQSQCHIAANPVLCLSNPGAASQQVQFCVPANHWVCCIPEIPVLCSTEPNTVFQQAQHHLPASPVACPSNPSVCQHSCPHQTRAGHSSGEWGVLAQALVGTGMIFWQGGKNPTLCQPPCHLHRGARKPCVWSCSLGINCAKCFICVETQLC